MHGFFFFFFGLCDCVCANKSALTCRHINSTWVIFKKENKGRVERPRQWGPHTHLDTGKANMKDLLGVEDLPLASFQPFVQPPRGLGRGEVHERVPLIAPVPAYISTQLCTYTQI